MDMIQILIHIQGWRCYGKIHKPENNNTSSEDCDNIVCDILRIHHILDINDTRPGPLERANIWAERGKTSRGQDL